MVRKRNDVAQEHRELIRRARAELSYLLDRLANEVLPEISQEFFEAVQEGGLAVPEIDRERMQTLVKRAVLRALDVKVPKDPKESKRVLQGK